MSYETGQSLKLKKMLNKEFEVAEKRMNEILNIATQKGGFAFLTPNEDLELDTVSSIVKSYEDVHFIIGTPQTMYNKSKPNIAFIEIGNDGTYSVYIENSTLNYGIHGNGKTVKEALEDFFNSYKEMKEFYSEKGKEFIEATFEFKYDVASFLEYYGKKC
ncbi:hypothetical protein ACHRVK_07695 [Flavobacterium plurextorum]|uniref:hypothetical protein n=2 Tax=Flavobacterium TaxID=237 RepID=UPI00214D1852|nr:hypothetical protein [Flavobacterium plurextorum]UUW10222.1 hypothetical protein NLG42_05310 [Flavobacterium plurextorum]